MHITTMNVCMQQTQENEILYDYVPSKLFKSDKKIHRTKTMVKLISDIEYMYSLKHPSIITQST